MNLHQLRERTYILPASGMANPANSTTQPDHKAETRLSGLDLQHSSTSNTTAAQQHRSHGMFPLVFCLPSRSLRAAYPAPLDILPELTISFSGFGLHVHLLAGDLRPSPKVSTQYFASQRSTGCDLYVRLTVPRLASHSPLPSKNRMPDAKQTRLRMISRSSKMKTRSCTRVWRR